MLSKSAAIKFFIFGTLASVTVFGVLVYDTFGKIPIQTNSHNLTESAIRGKHIWEDNNCMGCHTILGEGAYYAPELTKVYERRSEVFLKMFLKDPQAMYPGKRKMVNYNFTDQNINDIISFLKWISKMDLNGFPPNSILGTNLNNVSSTSNISNSIIKPVIIDQLCISCHVLNGKGNNIGPSLDDIGNRRDKDYLEQWLKDPFSIKKDSLMPKLALGDSVINELVEYLSQLKNEVK